MFISTLTLLGLDKTDKNIAPCCPRNHCSKNQVNRIFTSFIFIRCQSKKSACFKWTYGLSGNDFKLFPDCNINKFYINRIILTPPN